MNIGKHTVGSAEWNRLVDIATALAEAVRLRMDPAALLFNHEPDSRADGAMYLRDLESLTGLLPYRGEGAVSVFRRADFGIDPGFREVCLEVRPEHLPIGMVTFRVDLATPDIEDWAKSLASGIQDILDADPEPSF